MKCPKCGYELKCPKCGWETTDLALLAAHIALCTPKTTIMRGKSKP